MSEFNQLLEKYASFDSNIIILGDFNFHFDSKTDSNVKKIKSTLSSCNMTQLIETPTQKHHHIINWLIVRDNQTEKIGNLYITDNLISDH